MFLHFPQNIKMSATAQKKRWINGVIYDPKRHVSDGSDNTYIDPKSITPEFISKLRGLKLTVAHAGGTLPKLVDHVATVEKQPVTSASLRSHLDRLSIGDVYTAFRAPDGSVHISAQVDARKLPVEDLSNLQLSLTHHISETKKISPIEVAITARAARPYCNIIPDVVPLNYQTSIMSASENAAAATTAEPPTQTPPSEEPPSKRMRTDDGRPRDDATGRFVSAKPAESAAPASGSDNIQTLLSRLIEKLDPDSQTTLEKVLTHVNDVNSKRFTDLEKQYNDKVRELNDVSETASVQKIFTNMLVSEIADLVGNNVEMNPEMRERVMQSLRSEQTWQNPGALGLVCCSYSLSKKLSSMTPNAAPALGSSDMATTLQRLLHIATGQPVPDGAQTSHSLPQPPASEQLVQASKIALNPGSSSSKTPVDRFLAAAGIQRNTLDATNERFAHIIGLANVSSMGK